MNARRIAACLALPVALASATASAQPRSKVPPAALPPLPAAPVLAPLPAPAPAPPPRAAAVLLPAAPEPPRARVAGASAEAIRRMSEALADIAERVGPSVVQIDVSTGAPRAPLSIFGDENGHRRGLGSGVLFTTDGAILTNNHVIEDARAINVRLRDGRMFAGRVVGRDPATDLAVLRIDARGLPAASFADSDGARVGEWVLAVGSPFGLGQTVTSGVLSAKGRGGVGINAVEDYLQTDASINPGNSGGPLINLDGRVLGINTMIVSRGQGIGLAVPANIARRVAEQLLKTGRVDRAFIGLGLQDLTPQIAAEIASAPQAGALVNAVAPSGPGGKARLLPGDVIVSMAGKAVHDAQDVIRGVFIHNVGDTLDVELVRAGKRVRVKVTLESRNDPAPAALPIERSPAPRPGLGLTVRDATVPDSNSAGKALVTSVAPDSAADRAGIRVGDVVLEADGTNDPTAAQIESAAQDGHMLLRIRRQATVFYAAVRR